MAETKFRVLRERILRVSREDILRHTDLSLGTLRNVEFGGIVRLETALQLLDAVNLLLNQAGKPKIEMQDLGLTLRQDRRKEREVAPDLKLVAS
jgi:hypothetical protein